MTEDAPDQAAVGSDVFISYASRDAAVANSVVETLEASGFKCWIAPRDVVPGSLYADEIVGAINDAKVVVLVLSEHSIGSSHAGKEIERASSKRRRIIAFRIDSAPLTRAFEYFLSESQWIDVKALGMPAALTKLAEAVRQGSRSGAEGEGAPRKLLSVGGASGLKRFAVPAVDLLAVCVAVALGLHFWSSHFWRSTHAIS